MLDRIDMCIYISKVSLESLKEKGAEESSTKMRKEVEQVKEIQRVRYQNVKGNYNSRIRTSSIWDYCKVEAGAKEFLDEAYVKMGLTIRGYHKTIKVARTIADLDENSDILIEHMAEALSYRIMNMKSGI